MNSEYIEYVHKLKKDGVIRHVGMSSHNPLVAKQAVLSGEIEMLLFSINPAFDLLPASEDINEMVAEQYEEGLDRISPERVELYQLCEEKGIGITVMKGYAGRRLFDAKRSPLAWQVYWWGTIHRSMSESHVLMKMQMPCMWTRFLLIHSHLCIFL